MTFIAHIVSKKIATGPTLIITDSRFSCELKTTTTKPPTVTALEYLITIWDNFCTALFSLRNDFNALYIFNTAQDEHPYLSFLGQVQRTRKWCWACSRSSLSGTLTWVPSVYFNKSGIKYTLKYLHRKLSHFIPVNSHSEQTFLVLWTLVKHQRLHKYNLTLDYIYIFFKLPTQKEHVKIEKC